MHLHADMKTKDIPALQIADGEPVKDDKDLDLWKRWYIAHTAFSSMR